MQFSKNRLWWRHLLSRFTLWIKYLTDVTKKKTQFHQKLFSKVLSKTSTVYWGMKTQKIFQFWVFILFFNQKISTVLEVQFQMTIILWWLMLCRSDITVKVVIIIDWDSLYNPSYSSAHYPQWHYTIKPREDKHNLHSYHQKQHHQNHHSHVKNDIISEKRENELIFCFMKTFFDNSETEIWFWMTRVIFYE